jgi:hypothetical protein
MSWYEWFGFSSDPFIVRRLQSDEEFDKLFVKTDLVARARESSYDLRIGSIWMFILFV